MPCICFLGIPLTLPDWTSFKYGPQDEHVRIEEERGISAQLATRRCIHMHPWDYHLHPLRRPPRPKPLPCRRRRRPPAVASLDLMSGGGAAGSGHGRHDDGSLDNASRSGCRPGSPMLQPPLCRSVLLLPREVAEVEGAVTAATRLPRNDIVLSLPHICHATINPSNH